MASKVYTTKFGPMRYGDRRPDGFRCLGVRPSGQDLWVSPRVWKRTEREARRLSRQRNQTIKNDPILRALQAGKKRAYYEKHRERVLCQKARERARLARLPFSITEKDVHIPKRCPVLDIRLFSRTGGGPGPNSPTIDRIIPELGYVPNNVIVVSMLANQIKSNATPKQILRVGNFYQNLLAR